MTERPSRPVDDRRPSAWLEAFRGANLERGQPVVAPAPSAPPPPPVGSAQPFVQQAVPQAQPFAPQPVACQQPFVAMQPQPAMFAYPATQPWGQQMPMQPVAYPMAYPAPIAPQPYIVPQPVAMWQPPAEAQPSPIPAPRPSRHTANDLWPVAAPNGIDEIRDSLRDFREVLHDLAESRARRRAG